VSYPPEPRQKKSQAPATSGSGVIAKKRAFAGKKEKIKKYFKKNKKRKRKERKHVRCYMPLLLRKRDIIMKALYRMKYLKTLRSMVNML